RVGRQAQSRIRRDLKKWPRWARRTLKVAGAVVILVLGLELLLQAGALITRLRQPDRKQAFLTANPRVVCVGDSNTSGLYLKPEQSYPAVLERLWNAQSDRAPIEVLNLGYPGNNSSRVLHDFGRILRLFRPSVVLV